ncbi:MAG TPA: hypothetical protein H9851_06860 [Candidatus Borkfalkia faecavium]|uniref:Uncharacterized protein n=1 Tax=Candidatus Borkfalkia faecavium TaxID=2838508 RepID=A0A9D2AV27_9FIRM|nr:hypothetical protein [Candidatus Borkfalkia faecavium]
MLEKEINSHGASRFPHGEQDPLVYLAADAAADDRILTLQKAYDGGFITQGQLRQIARNMP